MVVIGLTGGIGTGKSTVSRILTELGAALINADKVGHEALKPYTPVWREVVAAFGREILLPNDEVDRQKLGEIVFNDAAARLRLNQIMHPQMFLMMREKIEGLRRQGVEVVILEAAVLLEANWTPLVDEVWVTTAPEATVIQRLRDRSGLSEAQVLARIRSQLPAEERIKHADVVINTDCSLDEVEEKVKRLWEELLAREQARRRL
jgi:dephospho-CoA kinase